MQAGLDINDMASSITEVNEEVACLQQHRKDSQQNVADLSRV